MSDQRHTLVKKMAHQLHASRPSCENIKRSIKSRLLFSIASLTLVTEVQRSHVFLSRSSLFISWSPISSVDSWCVQLYFLPSQLWALLPTVCVCVCVCTRCNIQFFVTPQTVARRIPLSMGFPRQKYWSRLPFPTPRDLPDPGMPPATLARPALAGEFVTLAVPSERSDWALFNWHHPHSEPPGAKRRPILRERRNVYETISHPTFPGFALQFYLLFLSLWKGGKNQDLPILAVVLPKKKTVTDSNF